MKLFGTNSRFLAFIICGLVALQIGCKVTIMAPEPGMSVTPILPIFVNPSPTVPPQKVDVSGVGSIQFVSSIEFTGYIIEASEGREYAPINLKDPFRRVGTMVKFHGRLIDANAPLVGGVPSRVELLEITDQGESEVHGLRGTVRLLPLEGGCFVIEAINGESFSPSYPGIEKLNGGTEVVFSGKLERATGLCPGRNVLVSKLDVLSRPDDMQGVGSIQFIEDQFYDSYRGFAIVHEVVSILDMPSLAPLQIIPVNLSKEFMKVGLRVSYSGRRVVLPLEPPKAPLMPCIDDPSQGIGGSCVRPPGIPRIHLSVIKLVGEDRVMNLKAKLISKGMPQGSYLLESLADGDVFLPKDQDQIRKFLANLPHILFDTADGLIVNFSASLIPSESCTKDRTVCRCEIVIDEGGVLAIGVAGGSEIILPPPTSVCIPRGRVVEMTSIELAIGPPLPAPSPR